MKNLLGKIWNWIWNLRNRFSFWILAFGCFIYNYAELAYFVHFKVTGNPGGGEVIIFSFALFTVPLAGYAAIIFIIEQIFKRLRFPDNKFFKIIHIWNLIQIILCSIPIILFLVLCYLDSLNLFR